MKSAYTLGRIKGKHKILRIMFGLGFSEILLILVVALIFLGPEKLPEVARTLGRSFGELKRAADEFRYDLTSADYTPHRPGQGMRAGSLEGEKNNPENLTDNKARNSETSNAETTAKENEFKGPTEAS